MRFLTLIPLLVCPLAAQANLIFNGSFEEPLLAHTENISGAFSFAGWSGVMPSDGGNGGLVVGVDNGLAPFDGAQHFNFNGGNPGSQGYLEQAFATVAGTEYLVSFAVGRAGGGQGLSLLAQVSGAGGVLGSVAAEPPAARSYAVASFSFTAVGAESVLRFADTSGGNSVSDLYVDGVSVAASAVPEPAGCAACAGAGALALAVWLRRAA